MRIALVIERFEPHGGGVEAAAWTVAHALAAAGDAVEVLARTSQPPVHPSIRVHPLRAPRAWQPLRVLWFSQAAARRARALGADLVHSFSRTRHQDLFRAGGGCHAAYMESQYGPVGARLRRLSPRHAVLLGIEEAVLRDPRQTLQCNSEMVRREFGERYGVPEERMAVIPNGVDLERFESPRWAARAAQLRQQLAPRAERVWLLAGSGFERKGLDVALTALSRSGDEEDFLWVAGRDEAAPWRRRAHELGVAERVAFLGMRDDLPALYAAADALLLPTRYDAFANVCLEAAASGLPVVTSGANGAAGWLGEAGLCVADPEDVEGFAAALHELRDPERRAGLGEAARRRAESASWPMHVQALRALYARLAS